MVSPLADTYVRSSLRHHPSSLPKLSQKSPEDFDADDLRRITPKSSAKNFPRILKLVEELQQVEANHLAAVTIAWQLNISRDAHTYTIIYGKATVMNALPRSFMRPPDALTN